MPTANAENYVWLGVETFGEVFADSRLEDSMEAAIAWGSPDLINIGGATVLSSMVSLEVERLARSMRHNKSGGRACFLVTSNGRNYSSS